MAAIPWKKKSHFWLFLIPSANFDWALQWGSMEKIYVEAEIEKQYICVKNNILY